MPIEASTAEAPPLEEAGGAYLRAFARHRLLVVVVTALCVGSALLWTAKRADSYQASASILVSPIPAGDPTFIGTGVVFDSIDPSRTVQTAAALLDSQQAAQVASSAMGRGWTESRVQKAVSITPRGGSDVLAVTASAPTAAEAARLANAFATGAVTYRAGVVHGNIAAQLSVLRERLAGIPKAARASSAGADLTSRLAQLRAAAETGGDPTLSVSQLAEPPSAPTGAPAWLIVVLAGVAGFAIGSVIALLDDYFQPSVRDERDVLSLLPVPILAAVPKVSAARRRGALTPTSLSPAAFEQIRLLRAQIPVVSGTRAVMVTSPDVGDGKTTIAAALAAALAESGQEVVLLDLDLRHPALARSLGLSPSYSRRWGLAHLFGRNRSASNREIDSNTSLAKRLVEVPGIPHLKIVPGHEGGVARLEEMMSRLHDLVVEAQTIADWVILDTPPVGQVSDAIRIAGACKPMVILVVRPRRTDRGKLVVTRELLARVDSMPVGTVLVGWQLAKSRGGSYAYRYLGTNGASSSDSRDDKTLADV